MLENLFNEHLLIGAFVLIISFLMVYLIVPNITSVIVRRKLNDIPDDRSSHGTPTPTMAGVAFFFTLIFTQFLIQKFDSDQIGINIITASTLIFFTALKDDLVNVSPRIKIIVEIFAVTLVLYFTNFQALNLHGFLGFHELGAVPSFLILLIGMLGIINSYNLIDGIDGLAAIIAMIIFSSFGIIFFVAGGLWYYILICLSFIGMLSAYLFYNFSNKRKIFMGDTGSLLIGFCIGICSIKLLTMNSTSLSNFSFLPENLIYLLLAILWIPIFDMLRVIFIRLKNKKSPFYPDRNHLHHLLIDLGLRHHQVALILGITNYLVIIIIGITSIYLNFIQMLIVVIILFLIFIIVSNKLKKTYLS